MCPETNSYFYYLKQTNEIMYVENWYFVSVWIVFLRKLIIFKYWRGNQYKTRKKIKQKQTNKYYERKFFYNNFAKAKHKKAILHLFAKVIDRTSKTPCKYIGNGNKFPPFSEYILLKIQIFYSLKHLILDYYMLEIQLVIVAILSKRKQRIVFALKTTTFTRKISFGGKFYFIIIFQRNFLLKLVIINTTIVVSRI